MDRMKFETLDLTSENIEKVAMLFPNCVTEMLDEDGKVKRGINFELLKQMLSADVVDGDEAYEFTWVGKKAAIVEANRPIRKTLRPCKEESVDWDTTENLYIEGDNLEVLKLLQESYLGKVKMIYIDPPYNTGNDFIYRDDFAQSADEYAEEIGVYDKDHNRLFKNTDTNGRFHSAWCSMMYSRLMLARNLLTDDGMIFISIDDHEQENLKKMCDEVFGVNNYISSFIWRRRVPSSMSGNNWSIDHEYVVVYRKSPLADFKGNRKLYENYSNPDNDPRGPWMADNLTVGMTATQRPNQAYDLIDPKTGIVYPYNPNRVWAFIPESMEKMIADNRIIFPNDSSKRPMQKRFKRELKKNTDPFSTIMIDKVGLNREATKQLQNLLGQNYFNYSKPLSLLSTLVNQGTLEKDSIVLDFFSGSATTAHAVMQLNAEDGGHRKFIMVQLPETCDEKSEAYKAGYKNICEIGKERIRRAGEKIVEEHPDVAQTLDTGFRVFKVDDSNMKEVYYSAGAYTQDLLSLMESNIKEDRTDLDLFFGCLLDWGLPLSMPYCSETIDGCTVHNYNDGDLMACFDENISDSVIKAIANIQPLRVVFRDSSFVDSPSKINVFEVFKLLAPNTQVKVI